MKIMIKPVMIGVLLSMIVSCKQSRKNISHQEIEKNTNEIFDSLVKIRRDLHMYPELSGKEDRTSKVVAEYLTNLGLEVKTNIAGNSVVGILKGGRQGKKIAWRADMDAIRIETNDTVKYSSQNKGIAHMCGHDVHTTIGLGIANVLSKQKDKLKGTVYFIFQSSEETFTGAKDLIENGLFEIIQPDEIYGLHIGPAEKGIVNTKAKELFAYQKSIQVKLKPETNEKEIKSFLTNILQEFVQNSPNSSPSSLEFLVDPKLGLENKGTIYKDYFILQYLGVEKNNDFVYLNANFLETNKEKIDSIPIVVKNKILNSKFKDLLISAEYSGGNPTVYNNPELTEISLKILERLSNNSLIKPIYGQVPYFNEDFIYYQQRVPGVLFFLGGSNMDKGIVSVPHTPGFAVDEETIKYGVKYFSSLVSERTNSE